MIINLNGGLSMNGSDFYFDELEIEIIEDEFDCDIEEYEMDCDECGFCDLDCDDCKFCDCDEFEKDEDMTYAEFKQEMDDLFEFYSELLSEEELCPDCAKLILLNFLDDWLDIGE